MFHSRTTRYSWHPCLIPSGFSFSIHQAARLFLTVGWKTKHESRQDEPEQLDADMWWNTGFLSRFPESQSLLVVRARLLREGDVRLINKLISNSKPIIIYTALAGRGERSLTLVQSAPPLPTLEGLARISVSQVSRASSASPSYA